MQPSKFSPIYILDTDTDRARLALQFTLFHADFDFWFGRTLALGNLDTRTDKAVWRCLDVGCGEGWYSAGVSQQFPNAQITGFDKDENAVRTAQQVYGSSLPNVTFVAHDALLPLAQALLPHAVYDVAFAVLVIIHTTNAEQSLTNIANALRPGGMLYLRDLIAPPILTFPSPAFMEIMRVTQIAMAQLGSPSYSVNVTETLERAGFAVLDSQPQTYVLGGTTTAGQEMLAVQRGAVHAARGAVVNRCHLLSADAYDALEQQMIIEITPEMTGEWTVSNVIAQKV